MSNLPHFTHIWVTLVQVVHKKWGIIVIKKDKYESVATIMVRGYDQVLIRYLFVPFFQDRVRSRVDQKLF